MSEGGYLAQRHLCATQSVKSLTTNTGKTTKLSKDTDKFVDLHKAGKGYKAIVSSLVRKEQLVRNYQKMEEGNDCQCFSDWGPTQDLPTQGINDAKVGEESAQHYTG